MGEESPPPPSSPAPAKVYYDGCPGCAMERRKEGHKGIPYKEFLFVGLTTLASYKRLACYSERRRYWILCWISWFPYFLPCLCISLFATLVLISCTWLPETLHKHKGHEIGVETAEASTTQESTELPKKSLFNNWPLMSSIFTYCVFSLHDTAYSEIFSLWTVSDRKYGGLSFSSKDVGQVLAVAGASLLLYQLFIYHWVNKILGPINSTRIASALSIPIIAAYPFMTHLSGLRLGVVLYSAAMIKSVLAITIITGTSLLQNNAVPQGQRGAANGIATTSMSLFKAVAPAGAGVLFSWAQKRQHAAFFPGDQMVFLLLNMTEVIGLMLTFKPFLAVPQQYKK